MGLVDIFQQYIREPDGLIGAVPVVQRVADRTPGTCVEGEFSGVFPMVLAFVGGGILMMRAYTDLVTWNEIGNEVTLVKGLTA